MEAYIFVIEIVQLGFPFSCIDYRKNSGVNAVAIAISLPAL